MPKKNAATLLNNETVINYLIETDKAELGYANTIKARRKAVVDWGAQEGFNREELVNHLASLASGWPVHLKDTQRAKKGEKMAIGSITPMHHPRYRATAEFKAINAMKSFLKYHYDANLRPVVKETKTPTKAAQSFEKVSQNELEVMTSRTIKMLAKANKLPEFKVGATDEETVENFIKSQDILMKRRADAVESAADKFISLVKKQKEKVEGSRMFLKDQKAQIAAKYTELIVLMEQCVDHGK
jgi:hypothetical protein